MCSLNTFAYYLSTTPSYSGPGSPRLFSSNIWCPPCSKLKNDPDKATQMIQSASPSRQKLTPNHPPTQILSTIIEGPRNPAFGDIPEVQLHQPANNMSTTIGGSSQNGGGTSSTQTNGGAPHQSPQWAPSSIQVIQGNVQLEQIQVEDWEDENLKDETTMEEELTRIKQEIERLHQEQEVIMRRQAAAQLVKAKRWHINMERARLAEL
jgi:hypothetical protein